MRWGKSDYAKRERWHWWFAWHPVAVELEKPGEEWVWLEYVMRREQTSSSGQDYWEYK